MARAQKGDPAPSTFLGDKAYDADWLRRWLLGGDIEAVIPARKDRRDPQAYDAEKYKWPHLIENFFDRLKEFRRIALRAEKTNTSFIANIQFYTALLNLR